MSERCGAQMGTMNGEPFYCTSDMGHEGNHFYVSEWIGMAAITFTAPEVAERVAAAVAQNCCDHLLTIKSLQDHAEERERASAEVMRVACAETMAANMDFPEAALAAMLKLASTGPELLRAYVEREIEKADNGSTILSDQINDLTLRLNRENVARINAEREVKAAVAAAYRRCSKRSLMNMRDTARLKREDPTWDWAERMCRAEALTFSEWGDEAERDGVKK